MPKQGGHSFHRSFVDVLQASALNSQLTPGHALEQQEDMGCPLGWEQQQLWIQPSAGYLSSGNSKVVTGSPPSLLRFSVLNQMVPCSGAERPAGWTQGPGAG